MRLTIIQLLPKKLKKKGRGRMKYLTLAEFNKREGRGRMKYLTLAEFNKRVREILNVEAMIGSTTQDEIRWKVNEIIKLTRIPVDIKNED